MLLNRQAKSSVSRQSAKPHSKRHVLYRRNTHINKLKNPDLTRGSIGIVVTLSYSTVQQETCVCLIVPFHSFSNCVEKSNIPFRMNKPEYSQKIVIQVSRLRAFCLNTGRFVFLSFLRQKIHSFCKRKNKSLVNFY